MKTITVKASKTYDMIIGEGLLGDAGYFIRKTVGGHSAVIVSDDIVAELYAKNLTDTLAENGYRTAQYIFTHGEASKKAGTFLSLVNFLAEEKLTRTDSVVALGGGITGDIAGFAAACYMRGVKFIQVPTTLLSAVDSSVGGKTGVNLSAGKNLLGAFYQPDLVLCDISLMSTLPKSVFRDGCAEVIKYGIATDRELFESLKTPVSNQLETVISRCVEIKRAIVAEDEFETGRRRLLNLGHTVGHAIELLSGYDISHGCAVAAGMAFASRTAVRMGILSPRCLTDILNMLCLYDLPVNTPYEADEIVHACLYDKKRDGENITMVFPSGSEIGSSILKEIPARQFESLIRMGLEEL